MKKIFNKSFRAAWLFYILIVFEIIFMISPFGIYYYSVYGKGLNFLNDYSLTSWLTGFFLPHIAKTSSTVLNGYKEIGWLLAIIGFVCFLICALQIYYKKFLNKGVVTGGIYSFIRHPQYLSLSICSFGLLLVWPRYIILIMFILMLFAYYLLALAEENECEKKFGNSYITYKERTYMFLPVPLPHFTKFSFPSKWTKPFILLFFVILLTLIIGILSANELKHLSIKYLYTSYSEHSATISLSEISKSRIDEILNTALSNCRVADYLKEKVKTDNAVLLNYVYPSGWFFADLPMVIPKNVFEGHVTPEKYDKNLYTLLITRAVIRNNKKVSDEGILMNTVKRTPLLEVKVDLAKKEVVQILFPDGKLYWGDIPTPIY